MWRQIIFGSVYCAMSSTNDVCQFKRYILNVTKVAFCLTCSKISSFVLNGSENHIISLDMRHRHQHGGSTVFKVRDCVFSRPYISFVLCLKSNNYLINYRVRTGA